VKTLKSVTVAHLRGRHEEEVSLISYFKMWMERFGGHRSALQSLDLLSSTASAGQPLENRLQWLVDLVRWVRRPGHDAEYDEIRACGLQSPERRAIPSAVFARFIGRPLGIFLPIRSADPFEIKGPKMIVSEARFLEA
jgi:hypothetical protein